MTSNPLFSSPPPSLLTLQSSKSNTISLLPQTPFSQPSKSPQQTSLKTLKTTPFRSFTKSSTSDSSSTATVDNPISSRSSQRIGARVRVKVPLKVYHIPKVPEFDLGGKIGTLKQYVGFHKGKIISANFPYKVEFVEDGIEGRDGSVKFSAHLEEDEFEYVD